MDLGPAELLIILFGVLPLAVGAFALYWVIRLAVRHGMEDRDRRAHARQYRA